MPKYVHRAKTLPDIARDYRSRFDASRSEFMTLSGATVTQWKDETGRNSSTSTTGTPTLTTVNGLPAVSYDSSSRHYFSPLGSAVADDYTYIVAGGFVATPTTNTCLVAFDQSLVAVRTDASDANKINLLTNIATLVSGTSNVTSAQDYNGSSFVCAIRADYDGATNTTWDRWLNGDKDGTPYVNNAARTQVNMAFGGTNVVSTGEGHIYEVLIYDRALSDAEIDAINDYLSNKWSIGIGDVASPIISTAATSATWQNNGLDPDGEGIANIPGKQKGEYSIVRLGDRDAPRVSGSNQFDDNYPMTTWGSNVQFWFDAADTGSMTFATGNARDGGTVSAWGDRTGAETADTATSGDSEMTFIPSRRGKPCLQGGTSGTPRSLETGNIAGWGTTAGDERLFWMVGEFETMDGSNSYSLISIQDDFILESRAAYQDDIYPGVNHATLTYAGNELVPITVEDGRNGPTLIIIHGTVDGSGNLVCRAWHRGLEIPGVTEATFDTASVNVSFGSRNISTQDCDGYVYECGGVNVASGGITDAQIDDLARFLCQKYDVDYMPDTTPLDIGLHARYASNTLAQTDCALWYRSDAGLSDGAWSLHPLCAALHTTPSTMTMKWDAAANTLGPGSLTTLGGRKAFQSFATTNYGYGLNSGNYNWAETTDFPAPDNGATGFVVGTIDSDSANGYPYLANFGQIGGIRRFNSSATLGQIFVGNLAASYGDMMDDHALIGNTYYFDEGDATTGGDYFLDSNRGSATSDPAYTAFGNIAVGVGNPGSTAQNGKAKVNEMFLWKHPLTAEEHANLMKYLRYRYNSTFPQ